MYCSQKLGEDFAKSYGLLRIYELYHRKFCAFKTSIKGVGTFCHESSKTFLQCENNKGYV